MIHSAAILAITILVVDTINLHTNYQEDFEFSPAQYSFEYGVRDGEVGVNYGQQETRAGTVTTGSYSVFLPDRHGNSRRHRRHAWGTIWA